MTIKKNFLLPIALFLACNCFAQNTEIKTTKIASKQGSAPTTSDNTQVTSMPVTTGGVNPENNNPGNLKETQVLEKGKGLKEDEVPAEPKK